MSQINTPQQMDDVEKIIRVCFYTVNRKWIPMVTSRLWLSIKH